MDIQIKIQLGDELIESREVVNRIVGENLNKKLDSYLRKYDKENAEGEIKISLDKNTNGKFDGNINIFLDGESFRYEREDYKKLDDLINHLFDKFKLELSNQQTSKKKPAMGDVLIEE